MADTILRLFTSGAYLPFALLLIYEGLRLVKDDTHWLNQGKSAAYAAAVLAGLSTLAPIAATGKTPNLMAIVTAIGAAYALLRSPTPASATI